MRSCVRQVGLALAFAAFSTPAVATVDVGLYWERISLALHLGDKVQTLVRVDATTNVREGANYLTSLTLVVGRKRVTCPSHLINDLPFPQLGTINVFYSGDLPRFDPSGELSLRFSYGAQPPSDSRYVETRILFKAGQPVARTFAIPTEHGGWQYQDAKP